MSEVFGLRQFYGRLFRVAHEKSYDDQIIVQVKSEEQGKWMDFSRCTAAELERERIKLYTKCDRCQCDIQPSVTGSCKSCFRDLQAAEAAMGC